MRALGAAGQQEALGRGAAGSAWTNADANRTGRQSAWLMLRNQLVAELDNNTDEPHHALIRGVGSGIG